MLGIGICSHKSIKNLAGAMSLAMAMVSGSFGADRDAVQARVTRDVSAGRPIVVQVIVALCDNENQGIVPVPRHLGNGKDPRSNLYWGAQFGVRTFFARKGGWTRLSGEKAADNRILDRAVLWRKIRRSSEMAQVYIVADAWDGAEIRSTIKKFLTFAAGGEPEEVRVRRESEPNLFMAGGAAHLVAFAGHNGLMDFSVPGPQGRVAQAMANSTIVLACASKHYFLELLRQVGSHPLLLTNGLMAPEAYTLDATIRSWVAGGSATVVREAAASAYQKYQKCGLQAARNLFWSQER